MNSILRAHTQLPFAPLQRAFFYKRHYCKQVTPDTNERVKTQAIEVLSKKLQEQYSRKIELENRYEVLGEHEQTAYLISMMSIVCTAGHQPAGLPLALTGLGLMVNAIFQKTWIQKEVDNLIVTIKQDEDLMKRLLEAEKKSSE